MGSSSFSVPAFGTSLQSSDITFLLQDMLDGMGSFLTQDVGSLNWSECYTNARALAVDKQFLTLMSNQLSPNSASIFVSRWAQIYNTLGAYNQQTIEDYIELKQSEFGTPPSLTNIETYLESVLGDIFIDVEPAPELNTFATTDGYADITIDGLAYNAPLLNTYVYVWQPRDNKDNLLMPTNTFNSIVDSYHQIIESWNPAYVRFITMNLTNRGFQDGYGNNYNGLNYNNYLDGYNVVSGTAGSTTITGVGTAFKLYPNGDVGDFSRSINSGFGLNPPLQVVDDSGDLQTYYVASVQSNTSLTLTSKLINNITSRTYRTLGVVMDSSDAGMDGQGLLNSSWID